MAMNLTESAISAICSGDFSSKGLKPVLQVIDLERVQWQKHSSTEMYRLVLSDRSHFQQGVLAVHYNDLVNSGGIQTGSIVKLTQFVCDIVQNHQVIIVMELNVVLGKCNLIGAPVPAPRIDPTQSGITSWNLTKSAITRICSGNFSSKGLKPVLQVTDLKRIQSQEYNSTEIYLLVFSDGSHFQQGIMGIRYNKLVNSGSLRKGSIVKLIHFVCNVVQNHQIITVIELDVVLEKCDLIGEPVPAPRIDPAQSAIGQLGVTSWNLTKSAITTICSDDFSLKEFNPVLQVIDLMQVQSQKHCSTEMYRLIFSDGSHFQQGIMATCYNELVNSGRLQKGSIVKLTHFVYNVVQNHQIITVIELDVVLEKCDLIGEPVPAPRIDPAQSAIGQLEVTSWNLTNSAITTICSDNFSLKEFKPVLQVIDLKQVQLQKHSSIEMYRLIFSDGSHFQQGLVATRYNELVNSGRLQKGSVVKLTHFVCNVIQNHQIITVIELDVIIEKCDLIGEPVPAPRIAVAQSAIGQSVVTSWNLTESAIKMICSGDFGSKELKPVLQVIYLKRVQLKEHSSTEKYRLVFSDGSHFQLGMMAIRYNKLVNSGRLQKGSIIRLTQFICDVVKNHQVIIAIELDVVLEKCDLIGEPVLAPRIAPAQFAIGQSGVTSGNTDSMNSYSHAGGMVASYTK